MVWGEGGTAFHNETEVADFPQDRGDGIGLPIARMVAIAPPARAAQHSGKALSLLFRGGPIHARASKLASHDSTPKTGKPGSRTPQRRSGRHAPLRSGLGRGAVAEVNLSERWSFPIYFA